MSGHKLRWLTVGLMTSAGAGVLALTSIMNSAYAFGETPDVAAAADPTTIGLIMGGSGLPIPGSEYVQAALELYINPSFPGNTVTTPGVLADGLFTPEGLYPLTGIKTLPLTTSVSQGLTILNDNIQANLDANELSTVFGYSQSAIISSLEMEQLQAAGVPSSDVNFVLIGDIMNPNGGIFARFPDLQVPSVGVDFYGATPADAFPTDIYTLEYDGYADFPQYPINFISDLNAFLGMELVHGTYLNDALGGSGPTPDQIANAILLPGSALDGTTDSLTNYYMIPTETAPLVQVLSDIPVVGGPLADLLGPDLTVLINLGYGSLTQGWSTGPANVPTPFGLFPNIPLSDILQALLSGTQEGIQNFIGDLTGTGPDPVSLASLDPLSALSALSTAASDPISLTDLVNTLTSDFSTAYSVLLPTADIVNALLTSIPAYNVGLFVDNLQAGNLLDAVGLPIAADVALVTLAGGFEFELIDSALSTILGSL